MQLLPRGMQELLRIKNPGLIPASIPLADMSPYLEELFGTVRALPEMSPEAPSGSSGRHER